jgi:hypothetical protein
MRTKIYDAWFRHPLGGRLLLLILITILTTKVGWSASTGRGQPAGLTSAEFSRLIQELSEEGGYFYSDNFISNETSYLHVIDNMRELGITGGAYVGVGPEQNFTYIAKIRPRIAFIVDIRRQAMIQHLMYKAIFHLSPDRLQFLSRLLSKPLLKRESSASDASFNELLDYFSQLPTDDKMYVDNLFSIRKVIQEQVNFPLTKSDQTDLERIYDSFRKHGLAISYQPGIWWGVRYPALKDIFAQTDLNGNQGNFLATPTDYDFLRGLQLKNLVIPVVGNFGGNKALTSVGRYIRKKGFTVTAFYTSNVEQYLFESGLFTSFAKNVRKLPINDRSHFIRSTALGHEHPARYPGHGSVTLLQQIAVFLRDIESERYQSYDDVITTNFIAAEKP